MRRIIFLLIKLLPRLAVTLTAVDKKSSMYLYVFILQTYKNSHESHRETQEMTP